MNKHPLERGTTLVAVLVAGLLAIAGPAAAQDLAAGELATVSVSSGGVDFRTEADHGGAILTVKGAGGFFRYEFAAGESPFVSLFDLTGETLLDGVYQWELELLPTPDARRALMIETTKNGGETPSARAPQSGSFTVVDGFLADPDLEEAVAGRSSDGWAGLGLSSSDPLVLGGLVSTERSADDSDAASAECEVRSSQGSANCEAEARVAVASREGGAADAFGVIVPSRVGLGDSDAEVAAGGASEFLLERTGDSLKPSPPQRIYDPEGANGRPRSEEDQR